MKAYLLLTVFLLSTPSLKAETTSKLPMVQRRCTYIVNGLHEKPGKCFVYDGTEKTVLNFDGLTYTLNSEEYPAKLYVNNRLWRSATDYSESVSDACRIFIATSNPPTNEMRRWRPEEYKTGLCISHWRTTTNSYISTLEPIYQLGTRPTNTNAKRTNFEGDWSYLHAASLRICSSLGVSLKDKRSA